MSEGGLFTCASCANWSASDEKYTPPRAGRRLGTCMLFDAPTDEAPTLDDVAFRDGAAMQTDYNAEFITRDNFGCTQHTARADK